MKKCLIASFSMVLMFMIASMIEYGVPIYKVIAMGIIDLMIYVDVIYEIIFEHGRTDYD